MQRGRVLSRSAVGSDARALAELHVATWRAAYRGLVPDTFLDALDVDARTADWNRIISDEAVLVAVVDLELIGFVSYGDSRDDDATPTTGEVYGLYVHPEAWSTGVGRHLHDEALRGLSARGHREATLWVLRGNTRADHFYRRQGWLPEGSTKREQRPGVVLDEVRYARPLP